MEKDRCDMRRWTRPWRDLEDKLALPGVLEEERRKQKALQLEGEYDLCEDAGSQHHSSELAGIIKSLFAVFFSS